MDGGAKVDGGVQVDGRCAGGWWCAGGWTVRRWMDSGGAHLDHDLHLCELTLELLIVGVALSLLHDGGLHVCGTLL